VILLDTNVVSEVMRVAPSPAVLAWLNEQDSTTLFVSTVTIAEIEYGLRVLPDGKRRVGLRDRFEQFLAQAFAGRVRDFDQDAARSYGEVMGARREMGRPMSVPDGQIAAVARSRGYAVATRNVADFEDCGLTLVNPFRA
jgi:predicted nucleic acid-binding protein